MKKKYTWFGIALIVAAILCLILLPRYLERERNHYPRDVQVMLRLQECWKKVAAFEKGTTSLQQPVQLATLMEKGVISSNDWDYLQTNGVRFIPPQPSDPDNVVVFEYKGTYRRVVVLKSGDGVMEPK